MNSVNPISRKRSFAYLVAEICASLLVLLFVYAALSKILDYRHFVAQINNQPFDNRLTPVIVFALPASEFIVSWLLLFVHKRKYGFPIAFIMMLAFTVYVVLVLLRVFGRVPCSCGGVISNLSWEQHLVFNVFFLIISLTGWLLNRRIIASGEVD